MRMSGRWGWEKLKGVEWMAEGWRSSMGVSNQGTNFGSSQILGVRMRARVGKWGAAARTTKPISAKVSNQEYVPRRALLREKPRLLVSPWYRQTLHYTTLRPPPKVAGRLITKHPQMTPSTAETTRGPGGQRTIEQRTYAFST